MKTKQQIARIDKSLALQRRTLANLEGMELADAGRTIELTKQIIAMLEARRSLIAGPAKTFDLVKADGQIWKSLSYRGLAEATAAKDSALLDVGPLSVIERA